MASSQYWMNRLQQIAHSIYNDQERKNVQLVQQYKKLYNDIQSQLDALYRKYSDGDTLSTTEMYRFNRLNNLQKNIKQNIQALGYDEELFLSKSLYQNFQDVVQQTTQYINKTAGIKIDWSYLDDKFIDSAIKQNWQGGNFSTRTWANKDKLLKSLNSVIINGIASGQSINNMAASLKNAMGVGAYDALRLARTETMNILNNGQLTSFKNAGYSKIIWLTAEDEKVCEECGPMDGKSFNIDETPDCPLHPNCRCTLAADPDSLNLDNSGNNEDSNENNSGNDDTNDGNSDTIEDIKSELESSGIKGKISIPPMDIDVEDFGFDDEHINGERSHGVSKSEAISFVKNARISIERWNGRFQNYYSDDGATFVDVENEQIRTSFKQEQYDDTTRKMLEVLSKYGIN